MKEPLGIPRGSVRAIVTILLVLVSASMLFVPVVGDASVKDMFVMLTGIAVRDYFATRAAQNREDGPQLPAPSPNEDV